MPYDIQYDFVVLSYRMILISSTGTKKQHVVAGFIDQAWHRPRRPSELGASIF